MVDAGIVAACAGLLATGLAAIYSVSLAEGAGWAQKQLVWTAAAALAAALGGVLLPFAFAAVGAAPAGVDDDCNGGDFFV